MRVGRFDALGCITCEGTTEHISRLTNKAEEVGIQIPGLMILGCSTEQRHAEDELARTWLVRH